MEFIESINKSELPRRKEWLMAMCRVYDNGPVETRGRTMLAGLIEPVSQTQPLSYTIWRLDNCIAKLRRLSA